MKKKVFGGGGEKGARGRMKSDSPFELKSSEVKYENPWICVREDKVVRPDGKDGVFGVVTMVDGVTVLPIDEEGNVYLAREYKYAVESDTIEAISGGIDEGEQPVDAARRELKEETGFGAGEMIPLGFVDPFTTVVKSRNWCFLARGLRGGETRLDGGEVVEIVKMPFARAVEMAMSGEVSHGASVAVILRAERYLSGRSQKETRTDYLIS